MISLPRIILPLTALISSINAAQAPFNKDSSKKIVARADFDKGKLHGVLKLQAPNGTVRVHLDITGLPEEGGPFQYHIHKLPVPASGDCEATGTHLNPYDAPPECDAQKDDSFCQVGDLSGKHGFINTTCFETRYWDPYLSLNPKNKAYPVGLGVNFHFANLTRFACANLQISNERVSKKGDEEAFEFYDADVDNEEELVPLNEELLKEYQEQANEAITNTKRANVNESRYPNHNRSSNATNSTSSSSSSQGNSSSVYNWGNCSENAAAGIGHYTSGASGITIIMLSLIALGCALF